MGLLNKYGRGEIENAPDMFVQFKIGENTAWIEKVKDTLSKKGNAMLVVTFSSSEGAQIKDYITDNEFAVCKLKQLQKAFGIQYGEQDIRKWIGKKGIVVCKEDEYNGNIHPKISYYKPLSNQAGYSNKYREDSYQAPNENEKYDNERDYKQFTDDIPF
jgi:hypothetical protein